MASRIDPCDLARRLATALRWPGAAAVTEREWRLIAHTEAFDAWLIAWPPGGKVALHDHGLSGGALSIIAGTLVESLPWRDDTGDLRSGATRFGPARHSGSAPATSTT